MQNRCRGLAETLLIGPGDRKDQLPRYSVFGSLITRVISGRQDILDDRRHVVHLFQPDSHLTSFSISLLQSVRALTIHSGRPLTTRNSFLPCIP